MRGAGSSGAVRQWLARVGCGWLCLGLSGCLRLGYDLLEEAPPGTPFVDLTATSVEAVSQPDGGSAPAPSVPERGWRVEDLLWFPRDAGAEPRAIGTADAGDAADAGSSVTLAQPCVLTGSEQVVSGFDGPTAGLEARGPGTPTLGWTAAEGSPNAGAIEFVNTTPGGGEVYYPGALGDLRNRMMSLNVRVEAGAGARVRLFLESGAQRRRARAPFRTPPLAQWDCTQVNPDAPASLEAGFDASDIVGAGLEIEASADVRVYVDQIAY